jgi:hypothetical protein
MEQFSHVALMWKEIIVDISIEQNTLSFPALLLPTKYTISEYLHYSHRRSNNIQNIDELRPSLLLRCQQNVLPVNTKYS